MLTTKPTLLLKEQLTPILLQTWYRILLLQTLQHSKLEICLEEQNTISESGQLVVPASQIGLIRIHSRYQHYKRLTRRAVSKSSKQKLPVYAMTLVVKAITGSYCFLLDIIIAKHPNGETGTIKARWQGMYQRVGS